MFYLKRKHVIHSLHQNFASPGSNRDTGIQPDRVQFIDGFRGIAILLVVFYHAFYGWSPWVAYGSVYGDFFREGWLGVQLFFLISGYVILMTLEKSKSFLDFTQRRWLRLFPGMLVVTAIILLTSPWIPGLTKTFQDWRVSIPGLLFLEPAWLAPLFGSTVELLQGSFWSLFVEVKFYAFYGGLFFLFGKRIANAGLAFAFLFAVGLAAIARFLSSDLLLQISAAVNANSSFQLFGWFFIGTLSYEMREKFDPRKLVYLIPIGLVSSFAAAYNEPGLAMAYAPLMMLIYFATLYCKPLQAFFANRFFVFFGFISYPLYLIHEYVTLNLIIKLCALLPGIPVVLIPVLSLGITALAVYPVARWFEPGLKVVLQRVLKGFRRKALT